MTRMLLGSLLIFSYLASTSLCAEPFSAVLDKIIEQLEDPETGYAKVQRLMFDRQVETFFYLLTSDRQIMTQLLSLTAATVASIEDRTHAEQSKISSQALELESDILRTKPWEGLDQLFSLAVRSQKVKDDIRLLSQWRQSLSAQIDRVLGTLNDSCSENRLVFPKSAFVMRDLMQRRALTHGNFGADYNELMGDVFGALQNISDLRPPPAHGGFSFSLNVGFGTGQPDGIPFIQGAKFPYMNTVDSQVLFDSALALAVEKLVTTQLVVETTKAFLGETAKGVVANILTDQVVSQVLSTVGTGMMVLGYVGLAYSAFKLVNGMVGAHNEYSKQIRRIRRINEIINSGLLDRASSEQVVIETCQRHAQKMTASTQELVKNLKAARQQLVNGSFVADQELTSRIMSLTDQTVRQLPRIEPAELSRAMANDLRLESQSIGLATGTSRLLQRKIRSATIEVTRLQTEAEREEAAIELEFYRDLAASSSKTSAYIFAIDQLQNEVRKAHK